MKTKSKKPLSLTEGDFDKIANLLHGTLDTRFAPLTTKKDLESVKIELKEYMHGGVETIMAELDRIEDILAEKEEVERLKLWAAKVGEKVGIKL